ncbi:MAG: aldo/keto reductase [Candidatus Latescibacterota bacterium]|nr:aldo/keto reductase [Candidatus Latescibacterota bacterium]
MADKLTVARRTWGNTGLSIPVIPFGTQGFGNNFGPVSDKEACDLIRFAVELGVNHFDCARCYGDSLRKLGVAIKEGVVSRDEIIISGRLCCHSAAKWGGYGEGRADFSKERALVDIEDQLEILGIEKFDAMLIHDPKEIEPTLESGGTLDGLETAQENGWVDYLGYGMRPHEFHLEVIETGRTDVLLTFGDFNLLRQTARDELLPTAYGYGMGILNGWSIMRGYLTGKPVDTFVPKEKWQEDHHRAESMREWAEAHELNLLDITLQYCLQDDRVHGNPIGSLNKEQLETNVRATRTKLADATFEQFLSENL